MILPWPGKHFDRHPITTQHLQLQNRHPIQTGLGTQCTKRTLKTNLKCRCRINLSVGLLAHKKLQKCRTSAASTPTMISVKKQCFSVSVLCLLLGFDQTCRQDLHTQWPSISMSRCCLLPEDYILNGYRSVRCRSSLQRISLCKVERPEHLPIHSHDNNAQCTTSSVLLSCKWLPRNTRFLGSPRSLAPHAWYGSHVQQG